MSRVKFWFVLLTVGVTTLAGVCSCLHTPPLYELGHLPAGICHWEYCRYELYRVNPPLARMVATLPLVLLGPRGPERDWSNYQLDPLSRETVPMGIRFFKANGERAMFWFTLARWAGLVFLPLGAWACYAWARDLWDPRAGLAAAAIWCLQPLVWGWAAFVMPDVPAAAVGAYASYRFWKWFRAWQGNLVWPATVTPEVEAAAPGNAATVASMQGVETMSHSGRARPNEQGSQVSGVQTVPSARADCWIQALAAGACLGLAQLTKLTLLVLIPIWLACGAVCMWRVRAGRVRLGMQMAVMLLLALLAINLCYGFRDSFLPLGEYRFASSLFSGKPPEPIERKADDPLADQEESVRLITGNRWARTWLARLPVPLPRDYVMGIDCQRGDFEVGGRSCFAGNWSQRGWWWYQPVGLAIKTPTGTLALAGLAAAVFVANALGARRLGAGKQTRMQFFGSARLPSWFDELYLMLPPACMFALLCTQTGFSSHVRYALPATPYLAIFAGRLAAAAMARSLRVACWVLIVCTGIEAGAAYPHGTSFFSVLVGGPARGHEWLLDSNLSCGQDLLFLRAWQRAHPEARPLYLVTATGVNPAWVGIEYIVPPVGPSEPIRGPEHLARLLADARTVMGEVPADAAGLGPRPGWYVVDVNHLHGTSWGVSQPDGTRRRICTRGLNYEYFRHFQPCGRIAHSYLVYQVTPEEAAALRRWLRLE